jgi:hypothetical protein
VITGIIYTINPAGSGLTIEKALLTGKLLLASGLTGLVLFVLCLFVCAYCYYDELFNDGLRSIAEGDARSGNMPRVSRNSWVNPIGDVDNSDAVAVDDSDTVVVDEPDINEYINDRLRSTAEGEAFRADTPSVNWVDPIGNVARTTKVAPTVIEQSSAVGNSSYSSNSSNSSTAVDDAKASSDTENIAAESCCVVCLSEKKEWMPVPCHHVCVCAKCKVKVETAASKKCPVCRAAFTRIERVYL